MYALYHETAASTSVHLSLKCNLMDVNAPQLVTTSGCRLRVYRTNPYVLERSSTSASTTVDEAEWIQTTKLECMLSVSALAPVRSMASVRIPRGTGLDMLLLAFDDAKLSIVAYDQRTHDLVTVSMHSFEDALLRGGYAQSVHAPLVVADVDSRCAAMLVHGRHLALVPFPAAASPLDLDDTIRERPTMQVTQCEWFASLPHALQMTTSSRACDCTRTARS